LVIAHHSNSYSYFKCVLWCYFILVFLVVAEAF
jgi:hypothetical protein